MSSKRISTVTQQLHNFYIKKNITTLVPQLGGSSQEHKPKEQEQESAQESTRVRGRTRLEARFKYPSSKPLTGNLPCR
jgi:hypothetical protein